MAHHYAGVNPDEAAQISEFDVSLDSVSIPGNGQKYNVEAILDVDDVMDDGDLVPAEVVKAQGTFGEFISEYEEDSHTLGIFLGYAENDWSSEEMWINTDNGREDLYKSTEILEEDYGLIETDFGDVNLTERGQDVYDAFDILSEYEN